MILLPKRNRAISHVPNLLAITKNKFILGTYETDLLVNKIGQNHGYGRGESMSQFALNRTGIESVDSQHEMLFDLINSLSDDEGQTESIVSVLNEYVATHFAHEESFMLADSYDGFAEHVEMHNKFTEQMPKLAEKLLGEPSEVNRREILDALKKYLIDWLVTHINKTDTELFANPAQFKSQGD
uniref:Hemerythrin-like domain-containing protein n=1 Tax=Magnetococcus massalia (strain MO-1) TaxID=451514 RepID=A0A1S7LJY2_MAGMO|nr:protein of unknown function [Candidatus Magnetococcus massalia]